MSYCRFRNTLGDLRDCANSWDKPDEDEVPDEEEIAARKQLLEICIEIVRDHGHDAEDPVSITYESEDTEDSDDAREKGPTPRL